jgi:hypothetical protein
VIPEQHGHVGQILPVDLGDLQLGQQEFRGGERVGLGPQIELGEGITMISCGWSNRTPWNSPREMDEDDLDRHMEKLAAEVPDAGRSVFNLHVQSYQLPSG